MKAELGDDWLSQLDQALTPERESKCPDCRKPSEGGPCPAHRCRAWRRKGAQCKQYANPLRGYEYCNLHGCGEVLQYATRDRPAVYCMNRSLPITNRCAMHAEKRKRRDEFQQWLHQELRRRQQEWERQEREWIGSWRAEFDHAEQEWEWAWMADHAQHSA